jgi:acyl-CoA thioesterase
MSTHALDLDTRLSPLASGCLGGQTTQHYTNFNGFFGGYTAACLLRAVMDHPDRTELPVALTVNYCAALAPGAFEIAVRAVRTGRSTQHWLVEMFQGDATVATASVVCGARRAVWSHHPAVPPSVEPPESVPVFEGFRPGGWTSQYEMRFASGAPDFTPLQGDEMRSGYSKLWMKDKPARPLDYLSLACMSDAFIIRSFLVRPKMVATGTVTLTTYFHGNAETMAAQGTDPLLCVVDAHVFNDGFADQLAYLWGKDGKLLATSQQIVWYKE